MKKFTLNSLLLISIFFIKISPGAAHENLSLSSDSVIALLTTGTWYDAYSGDISLHETYFACIPNTGDSIRWENSTFKLFRAKPGYLKDSVWILQPGLGRELQYIISLLNKDSLCLTPMVADLSSTLFTHSKPQPASSEKSSQFVAEISGDWYVSTISKNHEHQSITKVRFEISKTAPDSITYSGYNDQTLLWSENYKIILVYQKQWFLMKDKMHGYFSSYKEGMLFNLMAGLNEFSGETSLYLVRTSPLKKVNPDLIASRLNLFPNPCTDSFTTGAGPNLTRVDVVGLNGQLLLTKNLNENTGNSFDISTLNNGVYFVKGYSKDAIFSTKLIKQK